ncbi:hypothetical protein [Serratia ureilytica]|uniref:Bacteriophage protein n=1 Tax=Serratia ureilytica TaxID=300181 RepID=A0A9X9G0I3_9GAMM|nr:hypothetical protein [Serratia ureilytica]TXE22166.1 hypothetical protein FOT63_25630 [Serratia ureilytica]
MRYRREDNDGDYTFGQGDNTFLADSPETVRQAILTRLELWQGEWFLDTNEGTTYMQSVLGKQQSNVASLAIRDRISTTPGVRSILSFDSNFDSDRRRMTITATVDTVYGNITFTHPEA